MQVFRRPPPVACRFAAFPGRMLFSIQSLYTCSPYMTRFLSAVRLFFGGCRPVFRDNGSRPHRKRIRGGAPSVLLPAIRAGWMGQPAHPVVFVRRSRPSAARLSGKNGIQTICRGRSVPCISSERCPWGACFSWSFSSWLMQRFETAAVRAVCPCGFLQSDTSIPDT